MWDGSSGRTGGRCLRTRSRTLDLNLQTKLPRVLQERESKMEGMVMMGGDEVGAEDLCRSRRGIRFSLPNGMECVLNEHGIAEVPAMRAAGDFNLEEELGRAAQFTLEPVLQAKEKA